MDCITEKKSIGSLYIERNATDENPPYQRESAIWSLDKKQLLIDSILNKYDIPKFYYHDKRNTGDAKKYAVIDGKQRLYTIFSFLDNEFPLMNDFSVQNTTGNDFIGVRGSKYFRDFSDFEKELFKSINLDVVLVQNADDDDIEELFSRLNNGEPLNAAEKRNAMGGDMCSLIRQIAKHDFFEKKIAFQNKRYNYYEVAAKFLHIENSSLNGGEFYVDLKKKFLDQLVENNKVMSESQTSRLERAVSDRLKKMMRSFPNESPLLKKQAYPPLYYIFIAEIEKLYAHDQLFQKIGTFLEYFHRLRMENLQKNEEDRNQTLLEYGRLSMQGTNDLTSLQERTSILKRFFLKENSEIKIRDSRRTFSSDEKIAVWLRENKKCSECGRMISIDEMDADHVVQWAHGGSTELSNARCLCSTCNRS